MAEPDDPRLLHRLRAGRSDAFADLVRGSYQAVYRFLFHLTRDVHRAEDLTQETFSAAWERIAAFQGRSTLATWLHRIAYTKYIDSQRSEQCSAARLERNASTPLAPADPFEAASAAEEARLLHGALDELGAADRTVLVLHYLQGLSYQEMSLVLDEPTGTVKWRTGKALNALRMLLAEEVSYDGSPEIAQVKPIS